MTGPELPPEPSPERRVFDWGADTEPVPGARYEDDDTEVHGWSDRYIDADLDEPLRPSPRKPGRGSHGFYEELVGDDEEAPDEPKAALESKPKYPPGTTTVWEDYPTTNMTVARRRHVLPVIGGVGRVEETYQYPSTVARLKEGASVKTTVKDEERADEQRVDDADVIFDAMGRRIGLKRRGTPAEYYHPAGVDVSKEYTKGNAPAEPGWQGRKRGFGAVHRRANETENGSETFIKRSVVASILVGATALAAAKFYPYSAQDTVNALSALFPQKGADWLRNTYESASENKTTITIALIGAAALFMTANVAAGIDVIRRRKKANESKAS
ncbi:MAG TPA: hypothetical protein VMR45_04150 [Patescibacteria group bacterium]|nr:hypothetical protein [Patescibacteria group bacterium]